MSDPRPDLPSSWSEEEQPARRSIPVWAWIVVGALAVVAVAFTAITLLVDDTEERAWPAEVGGRPDGLGTEGQTADEVTPTASPGVYIWNSFDGWHLWVVGGAGLGGVQGTVSSDDGIADAVLSAPGVGSVAVDDERATFELPGDAELAGVDFDPNFFTKELTIELQDPSGQDVPVDLVQLGPDTPAEAVPVVIDKPVVD